MKAFAMSLRSLVLLGSLNKLSELQSFTLYKWAAAVLTPV